MKNLKEKKGFTLIEALITIAILGIISVGANQALVNVNKMWIKGVNKLALLQEARFSILVFTKFIQTVQGSTISITRLDNNQPVNSAILGNLNETIYVTGTQSGCGGSSSSGPLTLGSSGAPAEISQYNTYLRFIWAEVAPGTNLANPDEVRKNTYYKTVTLTTHLKYVGFSFDDSKIGKTINISLKLSKNLNPTENIDVFLKQSVVIKHFHSAGYYGD